MHESTVQIGSRLVASESWQHRGLRLRHLISVDKWDGAAVRNALDDEIRQILTKEYKYEESFSLPDGRLLISLLAVGAAGWALLWDWWYPFPASRPVLVLCVFSYFILVGLLTLYTKYIENGVFVVAKKKVCF